MHQKGVVRSEWPKEGFWSPYPLSLAKPLVNYTYFKLWHYFWNHMKSAWQGIITFTAISKRMLFYLQTSHSLCGILPWYNWLLTPQTSFTVGIKQKWTCEIHNSQLQGTAHLSSLAVDQCTHSFVLFKRILCYNSVSTNHISSICYVSPLHAKKHMLIETAVK